MAFPEFCNFNSAAAQAVAGKDILLAVYNADGTKCLAVAGQQSLTINRSADEIEVNSKDTEGGWKSKISGMKEWSIDNEGLYVADAESHQALAAAFDNSDPVCILVCNIKTKTDLFGGIAYITEYTLDAPYDDAMTYSASFSGNGALTDLSDSQTPVMPEGYGTVTP